MGVLGIARAKREHGVRQAQAIDQARVNANHHGAIATALDIAGIEIVQGRLVP